jgi:hypothetical protein
MTDFKPGDVVAIKATVLPAEMNPSFRAAYPDVGKRADRKLARLDFGPKWWQGHKHPFVIECQEVTPWTDGVRLEKLEALEKAVEIHHRPVYPTPEIDRALTASLATRPGRSPINTRLTGVSMNAWCKTCGKRLAAPEVAARVDRPGEPSKVWCLTCWDNPAELALRQYRDAQGSDTGATHG